MANGKTIQERLTAMKGGGTAPVNSSDRDLASGAALQMRLSRMKKDTVKVRGQRLAGDKDEAYQKYLDYMEEYQSLRGRQAMQKGAWLKSFEQLQTQTQGSSQQRRENADAYREWLKYKESNPEYRRQQAALKTVQQDQDRGKARTAKELSRQIDELETQIYDAQLDQMAYQQRVDAGQAPDITSMQEARKRLKKQLSEVNRELGVKGKGAFWGDALSALVEGADAQAMSGWNEAGAYVEAGANRAAAWVLRDLAKPLPQGKLKSGMLELADRMAVDVDMSGAQAWQEEYERIMQEATAGHSGAAKWVLEQLPSAGAMVLDQGLAGYLGAGTSAGMAIAGGQSARVSSLALMGVRAGGNAALEAKNNGATDAQALAYGVAAGGLEVFSEKLFGGNPVYDQDAGLVNKLAGKLTSNKTVLKILDSKAFDFASEGLEEIVTEVLDPVAEWAIYNGKDTEFADAASIGNAFLGGVFLSALGNVVDAPNQIRQARSDKAMRAVSQALVEQAQALGGENAQAAAQAVQEKLDYGRTPDVADVGSILDAMSRDGAEADVQAAASAAQSAEEPQRSDYETYAQYIEERENRAKARAEEQRKARQEVYQQENAGNITSEEAERQLDAIDADEGQTELVLADEEAKAAREGADFLANGTQEQADYEARSAENEQQAAIQSVQQAARKAGYSEQTQAVMLEGYEAERAAGHAEADGYIRGFETAYQYGQNGMSLAAAQKAAQGLTAQTVRAAWTAGKETAGNGRAGSEASYDGGKRNAGVDSGKPGGDVAGGAGAAEARPQGRRSAQAGLELGNRVRAEGVPQQSGKDLGIQNGSAKPSFREVPRRLYTQELTELEAGLKAAGATQVHFIVGSIGRENARAHVTRYADGLTRGTEVWIQADSSRRTAQEIAQHEEFHLRADMEQDFFYKGFTALTENLTDAQIQEMADRYAEAYEGCYDEADKQAIMEEMLADAFAGINRRGAQADRYTQLIRDAVGEPKAGRETAAATQRRTGSPERYSIRNTKSIPYQKQIDAFYSGDSKTVGRSDDIYIADADSSLSALGIGEKPFFMLKSNLKKSTRIAGNNPSNSAHGISENVIRKLPEFIKSPALVVQGDGRISIIPGITVKTEKNNTAPLLIAVNPNSSVDGTDAYEIKSIYGRENFANWLDLRARDSKIIAGDEKKAAALLRDVGKQYPEPVAYAADLTDGILSQSENNVKDRLSEASEGAATPQENDKAALAHFGRTYKWAETGYVLLNGARLDFSGRHEGGSGGYRSVDHRDIIDALGEDYGGGDYTGGMVRFMQEGNIRISPESGGINLAVMPTKAQLDALSDFISKERGEVILDIDDAGGNTVSSTEYPRGTHANKVLQDIRNYFQDGTLPEVSSSPSVSQFRYSESEGQAEGLSLDTVPKKAKDTLERMRNMAAAEIQRQMDIPYRARQEVLKPQLDGLINEYLRTGSISQESIDRSFEKAYEQGREVSREFYDQYKDIKDQMRGTKLTLSDADKADIADFNEFRKSAFGRLRIANEGGLPVDTAYQSLREEAPELFPESITHPADRLAKMLEVSRSIEIVERTLDEAAGPNAEEYKRYAKNDFTVTIENMQGALQLARRYAEARQRLKERNEAGKPKTLEDVQALYKALKSQRRTYERAMSKALLTEEDQKILNQLMRGERGVETLEGTENGEAIRKVFEAKLEYSVTAARIAEWKRTIRAQREGEAASFLKDIDKAKDKAHGWQLSRETMTRNNLDVFGEDMGAAINKAYFAPVRKAEADAKRYKDRQRGRVKELGLSRKVENGNVVSEAYAVQLLGEAEDNIRMLKDHPYIKERDGQSLQEWQALVQELWKQNPKLDQTKIRKGVETFQSIYDEMFRDINEGRVRNGYEPINYRSGYFPHFQRENGSGGIKELLAVEVSGEDKVSDSLLRRMGEALGMGTKADELPTTIAGRTYQFKPGIRWFGNAQERLGFATAYDALEGFDRYIEGAAGVIYQTDNIQRLRAFANQIRYLSSDEGIREQVDEIRALEDVSEEDKQNRIDKIYESGRYQLGHYIQELDDYTNLLANKKSQMDRGVERQVGRKVYRLAKGLEGRVAANMVAINPGSWLTNFGVIAQASAELKSTSILKAMQQTLAAQVQDDGFIDKSAFLTNRQGSEALIQSVGDRVSATLSVPMELIDMFSASTIVRARYMENLQRGMTEADAIDEADQFAADVMAERSKGGMPTLFESKNPLIKLFTQFQLEVNNTFSYLFKDVPRRKRKEGILRLTMAIFKFVVNSWIFNELYEKIVGRRSQLDPINLITELVGDATGTRVNNLLDWGKDGIVTQGEANTAMGTIENFGQSLAEELPFVGNLAGGGKVPVASSLPSLTNISNAIESDKLTAGQKAAKIGAEVAKPAAYWLPPFGGGQALKLWKGIEAYKKGGSYTADGRLQYPVYTDRKGDKAEALTKTLLFGKSATEGAKAWVEGGFGALSERATKTYEAMREAGIDQRDGFALVKKVAATKKTDDASEEENRIRVIQEAEISDEAKALCYYGMIASESEQEKMDAYVQAGMDMGDYIDYRAAERKIEGVKDSDGKTISGSKKQQVMELLTDSDFTENQKTMLFEGGNYTAKGFEPWTQNYKSLYKAVSTGKNLVQTLQSLKSAGYEEEQIREAITDAFRQEYVEAGKEERMSLRGYLRNAFVRLGLSDKQALNKIDAWVEEKEEKKK